MTRTQVSDPGPINPLLCIADDVGKMDSWADSWQGLPDSEKLQYKNRAREFQPECDQKKKGTAMLKKVGKMVLYLHSKILPLLL